MIVTNLCRPFQEFRPAFCGRCAFRVDSCRSERRSGQLGYDVKIAGCEDSGKPRFAKNWCRYGRMDWATHLQQESGGEKEALNFGEREKEKASRKLGKHKVVGKHASSRVAVEIESSQWSRCLARSQRLDLLDGIQEALSAFRVVEHASLYTAVQSQRNCMP